MNKIFNTASGILGQVSAKFKEDFQDGYINARRKFENSLAVPLIYGLGTGAFYVSTKFATIDMLAEWEAIEENGAAFGMGVAMTAQLGVMVMNGSLGMDRTPQSSDLLPWIRPSLATGFGVLAAQTFNNATESNVSLLGTGLVIGAAAFTPTITQLAGMATKARDVITKRPERRFE